MNNRFVRVLGMGAALVLAGRADDGWLVRPAGEELRIFRTGGARDPVQVAALHTNSAYFRLAPGPHSGWGTSVVLSPTFWSDGKLHQGAPVEVEWDSCGDNLRLLLRGGLHTVHFGSELLIAPPQNHTMQVRVNGWLEGSANLPAGNPEAFKPVFLSSMRVSDLDWDAGTVEAGELRATPPKQGFVLPAYTPSRTFGVRGGSSRWKPNAPSMWVELDEPLDVQGWVTESQDPNDDNVGAWAGSSRLMTSWGYRLLATLEAAEAPVVAEAPVR